LAGTQFKHDQLSAIIPIVQSTVTTTHQISNMLLSFTPLLMLAGCALAAPTKSLVKRNDSVVKYNMLRVSNSTLPLERQLAIKPRFFNSPQDLDNYYYQVYVLSNNVVSEISAGADEIRYSDANLTDFEALNLAGLSTPIEKSLTNIVNAFITSKKDFERLNRKGEAIDLLIRGQAETNRFFEAIISKMGAISQFVAGTGKTTYYNIFEKGIIEYRR
jgi:hypothetical protein